MGFYSHVTKGMIERDRRNNPKSIYNEVQKIVPPVDITTQKFYPVKNNDYLNKNYLKINQTEVRPSNTNTNQSKQQTPAVKITKVTESLPVKKTTPEVKPVKVETKSPQPVKEKQVESKKSIQTNNTSKGGESLVDWMHANNLGNKTSFSNRADLYKNLGLNLGIYTGTAAQNIAILKALKNKEESETNNRLIDKERSKELLPLDTPSFTPVKASVSKLPKINIKK